MKNKILPIVLIIFIISLLLICPVYATDENTTSEEKEEVAAQIIEITKSNGNTCEISLSKEIILYKYITVFYFYNGAAVTHEYIAFCSDSPLYFEGGLYKYYKTTDGSDITYFKTNGNALNASFVGSVGQPMSEDSHAFGSNSSFCVGGINNCWNLDEQLLSNYDVKDVDGNVLFQKTSTLARPQALMKIVGRVEMTEVLKEIVGILPLIIAILVSFLGLRKALKMLSMLLRRS